MSASESAPGSFVTGVFHHGITVRDVDRSLAFYRGLLGLELVTDRTTSDQYLGDIHGVRFTAVRMAFLRVPGTEHMVELVSYEGVDQEVARALPWYPGSGHIGFEVRNLRELGTRLAAYGLPALAPAPVEIVSGPNKGTLVLKLQDPDGYWIELVQRPPGWAGG
jgi:catechol 2,3-dioxygenase-like lactoylglutathione lyase family enzyme